MREIQEKSGQYSGELSTNQDGQDFSYDSICVPAITWKEVSSNHKQTIDRDM